MVLQLLILGHLHSLVGRTRLLGLPGLLLLQQVLCLEVVIGISRARHKSLVVETLGAVSGHSELLGGLLLVVLSHLALKHRCLLLWRMLQIVLIEG